MKAEKYFKLVFLIDKKLYDAIASIETVRTKIIKNSIPTNPPKDTTTSNPSNTITTKDIIILNLITKNKSISELIVIAKAK